MDPWTSTVNGRVAIDGMGRQGERAVPAERGHGPRWLGELGGACGDLGTLLPLTLGAITVAGLAPAGLLLGFGLTLVGTGLLYGLPVAVQPMKAVAAVILTGDLDPGQVAAAGMLTGLILLALGLTGAIGPIARLIPKSVTAGLQLGLGLAMAFLGVGLLLATPWLGALALLLLLLLMRARHGPAAPSMLLVVSLLAWATGVVAAPDAPVWAPDLPALVLPTGDDWWSALVLAVLPQLPLTLTNAVVVTAALARDLFPDRHQRVSERRLCLSSGLANLLLAPLGAMPMCHGAGGLQAQHRFGARTGAAPVLLGAILIVLALGFPDGTGALLASVPAAATGALLLVAGADLALSRRLFDARPDCWAAIAVTALLTVLVNPALGLACGWAIEAGRRPAMAAARSLRRGS